jgi:hypothetical protein
MIQLDNLIGLKWALSHIGASLPNLMSFRLQTTTQQEIRI